MELGTGTTGNDKLIAGSPEGMNCPGVSQGLLSQLGDDRIMDTPISEQGIVGVAIGASIHILIDVFYSICLDLNSVRFSLFIFWLKSRHFSTK